MAADPKGLAGYLRFLRTNSRWLGAGAFLAGMSSFGQTFFISIFSGAVQDEFGLSHGGWGAIYSAGTLGSAIVMIWLGTLTDRMRVRTLGTAVLAAMAVSCLAMAWNPSVWALPFVIFALRLTGQGMASHTAMVAIARWFVATRGRALAIAALGFSLAEAILPVVFVALLVVFEWRNLWLLAAVIAVLSIPILRALLVSERTPAATAEDETATGLQGRHWQRREVLGHSLFWMLIPALIGPSAFVTAFFFLHVHVAETKGWSHLELVALFPIYTAASVLMMLVSGWAIDRFGTGRLMALALLPQAGAFATLGMAESLWIGAGGMILMGLAAGAFHTVHSAFWAEFYGTRHLGAIKAMASAVMVFGSAVGPILCGALLDMGLPFERQMSVIAVYFCLASGMVAIGVARVRSAAPA